MAGGLDPEVSQVSWYSWSAISSRYFLVILAYRGFTAEGKIIVSGEIEKRDWVKKKCYYGAISY